MSGAGGFRLGFGLLAMGLALAVQPPVQARELDASWRSPMERQTAEGYLAYARHAQLVVWNEGYYDETANALELTLEGVKLPVAEIGKSYDLECHTSLHFADLAFDRDFAPWVKAGDRLRLVFRDEVFSRCWEVPVKPWSLKVEVRSAEGELLSVAEFRGQPARIRP